MKRSRLFSIALLACAAAMTVAVYTYDRAVSAVSTAWACAKSFLFDGIKLVAGMPEAPKEPAVLLVKAKAFVQRIVKRERPMVTPGWRMCPSI